MDSSISPKLHLIAWGGLLFCILVLGWVNWRYAEANIWEGWRGSGELREPHYSERVVPEAVFRTQANTWSNLAYVLAGIYVVLLSGRDWGRPVSGGGGYLLRTPGLGLLFGVACCYLGVGSGLFHASLTRWGQQLDVASMYSPLVVLLALNVGRWMPVLPLGRGGRRAPTWPWLAMLAVVASALLYVYKWEMSSKRVLPGLILAVLCFTVLDFFRKSTRCNRLWLPASFGCLVLAVVCRQTDVAGHFSGPDTWLQGHAFWHLFTAGSLACMYLYYRSERQEEGGNQPRKSA